MKYRVFFIGVVFGLSWRPCFSQSARLTSDASKSPVAAMPFPPGIYQPPQLSIVIVWKTNEEAIVVRQTVSSNVVQRVIWVSEGKVYTNEYPLATNVISVSTNEVR